MRSLQEVIKSKPWLGWLIFFITVIIVFLLGLFASSIVERRSEAVLTLQMVKPLGQWQPDNAVWGENFPREYESYLLTADSTFQSKHGGSMMRDYLEENPNLVILWAGYSFSKDYQQGRGHYHAVEDIHHTLRTDAATAGT